MTPQLKEQILMAIEHTTVMHTFNYNLREAYLIEAPGFTIALTRHSERDKMYCSLMMNNEVIETRWINDHADISIAQRDMLELFNAAKNKCNGTQTHIRGLYKDNCAERLLIKLQGFNAAMGRARATNSVRKK